MILVFNELLRKPEQVAEQRALRMDRVLVILPGKRGNCTLEISVDDALLPSIQNRRSQHGTVKWFL